VTARIRPENTASLRAFAAAGFATVRERDDLIEVVR
jgi:RimJ/RimL family protein N-acetyltransferase